MLALSFMSRLNSFQIFLVAASLGAVLTSAGLRADALGTPAAPSLTAIGATAPSADSDAPVPLNAYAEIGSMFAQNSRISELGWSDEQFTAFLSGVQASFKHQPYPLSDYARRAYEEMTKRVSELESQEREKRFAQPAELKKYMKEMSKRFGLQQSDSGLAFDIKAGGSDLHPGPQDTVVVSFMAASSDAQTDLPKLKADHLRTKVSDLLPGLAEGVQMMTLDSKGMFILPAALSFGSGKWPEGVDRGTPIFFLVTLHEVVDANAIK